MGGSGDNNSNFGKCWIYSDEEYRSISILKSEVQYYMSVGWKVGRRMTWSIPSQPKFEKVCPCCSKSYRTNKEHQVHCSKTCSASSKIWTSESREKLSKCSKSRNFGGTTSKLRLQFMKSDGEVVHLQSSYEIRIAESLELNGIRWTRPAPMRWIDDSGVEHRYYADFYLDDYDTYLDPKNDYLVKQDRRKIELVRLQNRVTLLVLDKTYLNWSRIKTLLPVV